MRRTIRPVTYSVVELLPSHRPRQKPSRAATRESDLRRWRSWAFMEVALLDHGVGLAWGFGSAQIVIIGRRAARVNAKGRPLPPSPPRGEGRPMASPWETAP